MYGFPTPPPFTKKLYFCPDFQGKNNLMGINPATPHRPNQNATESGISVELPDNRGLTEILPWTGVGHCAVLWPVNKPPWGALLLGPSLADWMWTEALDVFGRRGRRMGIDLEFLLGIKQVVVLKTPVGKNQGICNCVVLPLTYSMFTKCLQCYRSREKKAGGTVLPASGCSRPAEGGRQASKPL